MVAEQAKAASQLPISTGLDVAPEVDMDALSVGHEYMVLLEIRIEFSQTPADARANKGLPVGLEKASVVRASESPPQIQLDVGSGRR